MPKLTARLAEREQIAEATYAFQFDLAKQPFEYKSGQTIDVILPNPLYTDAAGNRRTFSIADAPGGERLLVATRNRGSAFKRSLIEAPLGTQFDLEGPYGSFTLPQKPSDVTMLAGGIGVTPFRAVIEDSRERSLDHTLTLIHSNRTAEEAPFLDELIRWGVESAKETSGGKVARHHRWESGSAGASTVAASGRPRFVYLPTMTQAHRSARGWRGERRRVAPDLLDDVLPVARNSGLYYVAGPARFVEGAVGALQKVGVNEDQIRFEEFPGY